MSVNSIHPLSSDDVGTDAGYVPENLIPLAHTLGVTADDLAPATFNTTHFGRLFTKHMLWALKNNQFNFNKCNTNRINFQVPVALFMARC